MNNASKITLALCAAIFATSSAFGMEKNRVAVAQELLKHNNPTTRYLRYLAIHMFAGFVTQGVHNQVIVDAAHTGLQDTDAGVRTVSILIIHDLLANDKITIDTALAVAQTSLKDTYAFNRFCALVLYRLLLKKGADQTIIIKAAQTGLKDADAQVRKEARTLCWFLLINLTKGLDAESILQAIKSCEDYNSLTLKQEHPLLMQLIDELIKKEKVAAAQPQAKL